MESLILRNITIIEINLLILISTMMGNNEIVSIGLVFMFMIIRTIREPLHYDKKYKCIIMSIALMITNFLALKCNIILAIITTYFSAIVLSKRNINKSYSINLSKIITEGFMYKKSKYDTMIQFRKKHIDEEKMKEFERRLNKYAPKSYMFYDMRIIKEMKYREIEKELECDNRKITDQLNIAFSIFKTYFDIDD